jgi:hypothetical protein
MELLFTNHRPDSISQCHFTKQVFLSVPLVYLDNVRKRPVSLSWLTCIIFFTNQRPVSLGNLDIFSKRPVSISLLTCTIFKIHRPFSLGNLDNVGIRPVSLSWLTFINFFTNKRPVSLGSFFYSFT